MIIEPARFLFMSCKESRKRTSQQRQMSDKFNHKSETIPVTIRGGGVSPRKSVVQHDVTSRVSDFQNGEQSVHRRDG